MSVDVLAMTAAKDYRVVQRWTTDFHTRVYWLQARQPEGAWVDARGPFRQRPAVFRRLDECGPWRWSDGQPGR